MAKDTIIFEYKGIGSVLSQTRLAVPVNQREYSWEPEQVQSLLEDFNSAISKGADSGYFLGTIVLTRGKDDLIEVADGQQRLATCSILLAAIRDTFALNGNASRAASVAGDYLKTTDLRTEQVVPKLQLNIDDNAFFVAHVLAEPGSEERKAATPTKQSHERIASAAGQCREFIDKLMATHNAQAKIDVLIAWVMFVRDGAQVIVLNVPDHMNAFEMFETLNDRGLKVSQADLLKNHLLNMAGNRIKEAQQQWSQMIGAIEALGIDDLTVTYLRHFVIGQQGPTRERDLFSSVKAVTTSQTRALEFSSRLASTSPRYAALFNPEHAYWNEFLPSARGCVRTIIELKVEQVRPLMLAVVRRFDMAEAQKALRLFVAWSVRFLIVGVGRGGTLDKHYGLRAQEVTDGKIETAKALAQAMEAVVPPDATFEAAFREARVSQTFLARYYLRALERFIKEAEDYELVPNEDEAINLEHILPENPGDGWSHIPADIAVAQYKRIGNMVLLKAKKNAEIGNQSYAIKKPELESSGYILTRESGIYPAWDLSAIEKRQSRLAALAVRAWPTK